MALNVANVEWAQSQKNGSVTFTPCKAGGAIIQLRLQDTAIVWEPSVYGGDGSENRVNISFKCPAGVAAHVHAMEASLGEVCSCLRDDVLKCKVSLDKVAIYDENKQRIAKPISLKGWSANAIVNIRGKWATRTQQGLCLECTNLQLLSQGEPTQACPF